MNNLAAVRWIVTILFSMTSLVCFFLMVPLWLGKVPPNRISGFRTPVTLSDPALWYRVNTAVGRSFVLLSILILVLALLFHFTITRNRPTLAAILLAGLFVVGSVLATAQGYSIIHAS